MQASVDGLSAAARVRLESAAPRYTSYPTAPHFTPEIGSAAYAAWLAALPAEPLSLYLHVPFCAQLCWYCGCATTVARGPAPIVDYLELLADEIGRVADRIGRRAAGRRIHLGGGTPTLPGAAALGRLLDLLGRRFDLAGLDELAIEIDPRGLDAAALDGLAALGLTRVSIGVQDFEPEVQALINRRQSFAETAFAIERLRAGGVRAVNLDLIYGLPAQTEATLLRSVEMALALDPDRIALFGYAHVPWMRRHQRLIPDDRLPDAMARLAMATAAAARLAAAGYVRVGIDHFAKPGDGLAAALAAGRLRRNFQGYVDDDCPNLLGFGASAIGATPAGYVQNHAGVPEYRDAIRAGGLATARGVRLTADDRLRRAVIERLMCGLAVDLDATAAEHGANEAFAAERARLAELAADGLVAIDGGRVVVPEAARGFVRLVAAVFDARLAAGVGRHAVAA